nr:hypothetical protein CFP56_60119 [Quercus suber]
MFGLFREANAGHAIRVHVVDTIICLVLHLVKVEEVIVITKIGHEKDYTRQRFNSFTEVTPNQCNSIRSTVR